MDEKKITYVKMPILIEGINIVFSGISRMLQAMDSEVVESPQDAPAPPPSLEDVRAVLAEISRKGKTKEMKELLTKFGAAKLSEIDPSDYPALLGAAKEVQNA